MYYETYRGKTRKTRSGKVKRRSGCLGWLMRLFFKLLALVLVLAVLAAGVLYVLPPSFLNIETGAADLALTDGLPSSRINVLLLGLDKLNEGSQRSDSMIIASIGYNSIRLSSVMRDTLVNIPGHGEAKINSAYAHGGAEAAMRAVNETFGLNITRYVAVDFVALVELIDALGGVDVTITQAELEQINANVRNVWRIFQPLGYDAVPMTQTGEVHLDGLFALGYARIRKIDSDYARTNRQRTVINAMLDQFKKQMLDPEMYRELLDVFNERVDTNLSWIELVSIAEKAVFAGDIQTTRVPQDQHCTDNGSSIRITLPEENKKWLRSFIYD